MSIVYLAPLEGVTDAVFRQTHHACFGGVSKYFIPFVSPTQNLVFTSRDLSSVAPEHNIGVPAVPQLLAKDAALFNWAAGELAELGYSEVNLNLGCPSGTVTAKGKGSGLLADYPALERFLDGIFGNAFCDDTTAPTAAVICCGDFYFAAGVKCSPLLAM